MNRDAKVWLSKNIKIDKDYRNVLKINESDMISLMTNNSNLVYYDNHYSFLRENINEIYVQAPYGTCLQANYIAFQNPDYSNKIFFGFIDDVIFENNQTTRICFTIDVWTTWYSYWDAKACFVIREHVTDDTVGLHTVPEGLETGEYIINATDYMMFDINHYVVIAVSSTYNTPFSKPAHTTYNGIFSGEYLYTFSNTTQARNFINIYDECGQGAAINSVYMIPGTLFNKLQTVEDTVTYSGSGTSITCTYLLINGTTATIIENQKTITMQTTLNGYTPKNNKLKCYPYNVLQVDNNNGGSAVYHYEKFVNNSPSFRTIGALTPGCSIMCYPLNYNLINDDLTHDVLQCSYSEGIPAGKYPVGSWNTDVYTNWLTQTGVNRRIGQVSSSISAIGSTLAGDFEGAGMGLRSIFNSITEVYTHSLIPDQTKGNTNSGDVTYASLQTMFAFKKKSIKQEYARIIDDYFNRTGYKINRIKVPNMSHRQNFNYVQIGNEDNVAYPNNYNNICPPPEDLVQINNLFRRGVTLWNSHSNLGDYSVSNNITQ